MLWAKRPGSPALDLHVPALSASRTAPGDRDRRSGTGEVGGGWLGRCEDLGVWAVLCVPEPWRCGGRVVAKELRGPFLLPEKWTLVRRQHLPPTSRLPAVQAGSLG